MGKKGSKDGDSDQELIRRALASPRHQKALIDRLDPMARARVRRALKRWQNHRIAAQDEDDLVHEIFAALFAHGGRDLRRYDPSRGSLRDYVSMYAKSRLQEIETKELRRLELLPQPEPLEGIEDPPRNDPAVDELVIMIQTARRIYDCVKRDLTDRGREMLRLMFDRGLSDDEIESLGVARNHIHRWRSTILETARQCHHDLDRENDPSPRRSG